MPPRRIPAPDAYQDAVSRSVEQDLRLRGTGADVPAYPSSDADPPPRSVSRFYDRFSGSPEGFRCLFRFAPVEFDHFSLVELEIVASRSRRGKPAALSPKDSFLALLYHLVQYQ